MAILGWYTRGSAIHFARVRITLVLFIYLFNKNAQHIPIDEEKTTTLMETDFGPTININVGVYTIGLQLHPSFILRSEKYLLW